MEPIKISLTGTPNCGISEERTETFFVEKKERCILIKDEEGKIIFSFNPFFDGGSVWLSDFPSIILDVERWGENKEGKFVCLSKETLPEVSSATIKGWREDSLKLAKIREARKLLIEEE